MGFQHERKLLSDMRLDNGRHGGEEILVFPIAGVAEGGPGGEEAAAVHADVFPDAFSILCAQRFEGPAEGVVGIIVVIPGEFGMGFVDGADGGKPGDEERDVAARAGNVMKGLELEEVDLVLRKGDRFLFPDSFILLGVPDVIAKDLGTEGVGKKDHWRGGGDSGDGGENVQHHIADPFLSLDVGAGGRSGLMFQRGGVAEGEEHELAKAFPLDAVRARIHGIPDGVLIVLDEVLIKQGMEGNLLPKRRAKLFAEVGTQLLGIVRVGIAHPMDGQDDDFFHEVGR